MRAMILAGGMSTRLYPLTKQVPKPIVPVAGEPISGHVLRWLSSFGYDEVAINVFYLAELDGTFVVVGCDDLTDANLASLVRFHKERGALATIGLLDVDEVDQ
ncbi:MAG: sugar phosphate nucleotidyltransferase [Candidatus Eremiobacteraeota bacterium]|nr:sugar phosphate nucleotidyltransferase [Candidatus Eremiobacteraeota bacterium]